MKKLLELFSGTQSISRVFHDNYMDTFAIDNNPIFTLTDWTVDILKVTPQDILEKFGQPDFIWASPPCTYFSVSAIGRNWHKETNEPKTEGAKQAIEIVKHTLYLIEELKPKYFFIENPVGKLRKLNLIDYPRYTVTYCQYGDNRQKPTDIWTNHPNPNFKPMCKRGMPCHQAAPRGSQTGTQGMLNSIEKARIPEGLCKHIYDLCKENEE